MIFVQQRKRLVALIFGGAIILAASSFYFMQDKASATLAGWNAGNIISDAVMSNSSTMTVSQIQSFLKSKNSCNNTNLSVLTSKTATKGTLKTSDGTVLTYTLKNGHFVCMADDLFNGQSAAQIIYNAAKDYKINPQVLIVLLEKEQGLISDTWPNNIQYRSATGYGCSDTAACNSKYYGLKNQIRNAAKMFREILNGEWTNYPIGKNTILYNPNRSCGSSTVYVQNLATSALYTYTPYQPNKAALAAGTGTVSCGAYGNRNFYNWFTDWFGSTNYTLQGRIGERYNAIGGKSSLGNPISNEITLATGGKYQKFEKGQIYWRKDTGAWEMKGKIGARYKAVKADAGSLGYPTSAEKTLSNGSKYQEFENGRIYWNKGATAYNVSGRIGARYLNIKAHKSRLGEPLGNELSTSTGGKYQQFERGRIYWTKDTEAWDMGGKIGKRYYNELRADSSPLGYPTSGEKTADGAKYQEFTGGRIYWSTKTGARSIYGKIGGRYSEMNFANSRLKLPTSNEVRLSTGGVYQQFEGGRIYYSAATGAWDMGGKIGKRYYNELRADSSPLGYPTSGEKSINGTKYQEFTGGKIYYNATIGTRSVYGKIGVYYDSINATTSRLRLPIGNEVRLSTGGVYQQFEGGRIYYSAATGAWDIGGKIGKKYLQLGADKSKLSYPKGPEIKGTGVIRQEYTHGTITYTGTAVTYVIK